MRRTFRVMLFNGDEESSAALRSELLGIPGLQIVAEVDELALLPQAVSQFQADLLLVHLDPFPELSLPAATEIAIANPQLPVFVLSESTDGQFILAAMQAGIREFLTKPLDRARLEKAVDRVVAHSTAVADIGPLITVFGTIGGAGASTLAVNLAAELNDLLRKRPVAVVDLDFRYGQLGTMLDLQADYTVADLCDTPEQLDQGMLQKAMVKHSSGVHLLARPNQFTQAAHITAAHCASVLSALQHHYEFVVVDGPNRFDSGGMSVLDLADVNLVVIQLLVTSVRNVHRMFEDLRGGGYNLSRFQLVCNRMGLESGHLEIGHVEKTLNFKIRHEVPDDWKTASTAINMGVPLIESAPKSRLRAAIRSIAEQIAFPDQAPAESEQSRGGLLGRLFQSAS